jgi:archaemetzincin
MSSNSTLHCTHLSASVTCSQNAARAGFKRPDTKQRLAATRPDKPSKIHDSKSIPADDPWTFPAPLLLPGDDLSEDPEYPPQSFQEWLDEEDRNPVSAKRKTVYAVTAPDIEDEVQFMRAWHNRLADGHHVTQPSAEAILDYLQAFYHGLPVKSLSRLSPAFTAWDEEPKTKRKPCQPKYVALKFGKECVRIRIRPSPDGVFGGQLNLDDLLDAAIAILPKDAYALLLLVNQDLYEDEDDEFVCGRAYGASRVAVVSSARYNPALDEHQSVERLHAWPASHCEDFIATCCTMSGPKAKRQKTSKPKKPIEIKDSSSISSSPLMAAISIYRDLETSSLSPSALSTLWLGRICRTAAHELGHCFGIDHCVYYACAMQGTASIREDARQPPFPCPVDLAKLTHATGATAARRCKALLDFCDRTDYKDCLFFAPFAGWIRGMLSTTLQ